MIGAFRRKYLAKDGWLIYRVDHGFGLDLLPAFLRARAGADSVREDIWIKADLYEGQRTEPINLHATPHVGKGPGIHDDDWFGEISVVWRGAPMHFLRQYQEGPEHSQSPLTLVAFRDRAALERLGLEAIRFWRQTFCDSDEIHVINGGNIPLPKLTWNDLILPASMRDEIRHSVDAFLVGREHYKRMGLPYRRGFLFIGPPGGGKTSAARVIMANTKARCLALQLKEDLRDMTIEYAFREAARTSPSILLVEDLDRIVESRNVSLSFLLNLLDGIDGHEGFLMIATSNRPERLDPALLQRPSRFDRVWEFGLPGLEERVRMLQAQGPRDLLRSGSRRGRNGFRGRDNGHDPGNGGERLAHGSARKPGAPRRRPPG